MKDAPPLTPLEVVEYFGELTGIRFRLLPYDVQKQASAFARHFELWELRLVVEWTRAMIRAAENGERNGFSKLSLQWHRLIAERGDEGLGQFQQRLGLALEWARRHRPSLLPPVDVAVTIERVETAAAVAALPAREDDRTDRIRRDARAGFAALRDQLSGGSEEELERLPTAGPKTLPPP